MARKSKKDSEVYDLLAEIDKQMQEVTELAKTVKTKVEDLYQKMNTTATVAANMIDTQS